MEKGSRKDLLTMIGPEAVLEGSITVPHAVRIDGTLKGKLETVETVTIGVTGVVEADIRARNAIIGGKVIGNLEVEDRVELESNASLNGDLRCKTLIINEGATFQGKSLMGDEDNAVNV
jgi:cytoskeletal protein CcmA (bactofilin family)